MNDNPYAPPKAIVSDIEAPLPERPPSVVRGVWSSWVSAACALPVSVYELIEVPKDMTPVENVVFTVVALAVAFAIAWLLNTAAWRGRNWSRWVQAILVTFTFGGLLFIAMKRHLLPPNYLPRYLMAQYVVQAILNLVAVIFLFSPSANAWYREMRARR
jgi:hypothetical protein